MPLESVELNRYTRSMSRKPTRPGRAVPGLMSIKQAAERKGVSRTAIYNAIEAGKLHAQRVGAILVLSEWEVEAWQPQPRGPQPRDGRRHLEQSE